MTEEIEFRPTFLLRGINHHEVLAQYQNGDFNDITRIRPGKDIEINQIPQPSATHSTLSETETFKTRGNHRMTLLMTEDVVICDNDGNAIKSEGYCDYCRDPITGEPLGIPVSSEFDPVTLKTVYHTNHKVCHFECANALLSTLHGRHCDLSTPIYSRSPIYLRNLFSRLYPNETIKKINHWQLHENFGGPLSSEQFHHGNHIYYSTDTIRIKPVQRRYIEMNE